MKDNKIIVKGAREHNLQNIDVEIPRNKLCVITGLSGSGKSSLAFDTLYAEGQRRYVESLSAYARHDELEPGAGVPTYDAVVHFAAIPAILVAIIFIWGFFGFMEMRSAPDDSYEIEVVVAHIAVRIKRPLRLRGRWNASNQGTATHNEQTGGRQCRAPV